MTKSNPDKLKQLLSHPNYRNTEKHKEIYDYFKAHADMAAQPPLYLLLYAINNILYPSFLIEQAPDVLDLLGQVELLRQRAVQNCLDILQLNTIYKTERRNENLKGVENAIFLLNEQEEENIERLLKRKLTDRDCFIDLIHWICLHHLRHLLTLGNASQVANYVTAHYGETPETTLPKLIMYSGWDDEEQLKVVESKADAERFILGTYAWEDEQGLPENVAYDEATRTRFECKFPPEMKLPKLIRLVEIYLGRVKEVVDILEAMFPTTIDM